ncbi:MAG: ribonuclease HII [Spirochaetales bacterium]|nr:ribonuclease HII [Spirochaetales bacterium]
MEEQQLTLFDLSDGIILGCDEAGRGPLCGPVVTAGCVLSEDFPFEVLNDSKKLSEKQREYAERIIKEKAVDFEIIFISNEEIDEINILQASLKGMAECAKRIMERTKVDTILIDGNKVPKQLEGYPVRAEVKGDARFHEIMAASILAKTARDRFMLELDEKYPEYNFKKNKGYPTKEHIEAIEKYGLTPYHRRSFHW